MKTSMIILVVFCMLLSLKSLAQNKTSVPVNAEASAEAKELLSYLYEINGKHTLSGMHNVLGKMSVNTDSIYKVTGEYPAIWGGDFGFADASHDIDNIAYRPLFVPEIIKQHQAGSIIVLSYHQANPLIGEPCDFEGGIISKLSDDQWKELTTKGTPLYEKWRKQMDLLAGYLVQLKDAGIPIIFRPYHEMNGSWFWWGGRSGKTGFQALWKQLFDYYTKHHHLTNILWAWTPDKPTEGVQDFYPDDNTVDILGCDIYPIKGKTEVYPQEWFDRMKGLANGKPLALTENSVIVDEELLKKQPWVWFMSWGEMVFNTSSQEAIRAVYQAEQVSNQDDIKKLRK